VSTSAAADWRSLSHGVQTAVFSRISIFIAIHSALQFLIHILVDAAREREQWMLDWDESD